MLHIQNVEKINKLLCMALHPETPMNEALVAHRKANSQLAYASIELPDLHPLLAKVANLSNDLKTLTAKTETAERTAASQTEAYEAIIESLKEQIRTSSISSAQSPHDITNEDGSMDFMDFRRAVVDKLEKENAWQIIFFEQTGVAPHDIQRYRVKGTVPSEIVEKIANLQPVKERKIKAWTMGEVKRFKELWKMGETRYSHDQIAAILTKEFGRVRNANAIKGMTTRVRKEALEAERNLRMCA